ncbi:M48 family metalloprotease [Falsiroseomonas sp. HW251]|uniref:M48 family metalloprotease n=1 Tax=Falsiroseomonas sp. HW251 TaxID=3390998 RepID=UPI003D313B9B
MRGGIGRCVRLIAVLLLAIGPLAACDEPFRPPEVDRAAVAAASREIAATSVPRPVTRPREEEVAMLRRVAERVAAAAQPFCRQELRRDCRFDVVLAEAGPANAYASGRDRITVTAAMLRLIANDDELAAIMAHEMAHHILGHIGETGTRMQIGALIGSVLGGVVADLTGVDLGFRRLGAQAGAYAGDIGFSKAQEREADYLGAWIASRAGFDLDRAGAIWAKLTHLSRSRETSILDSHPAGPERLALWRRTMDQIARDPARGPRRG